MTKFIFFTAACIVLTIAGFAQLAHPVPTPQQLKWHNSKFYLFTHFGPNTFTDKEWGHGDEPEDIFNPTALDCRQWCRIAKQAGATGIIITAKHHDGFCLWPSKYSKHTVRESKWKNGKGDVLKELAAACKEFGLNFGVYISPWDRNHPDYGTEKYNDVFVKMMEELFTNYGPITELWWDGANGEGPNGKQQVYDWKRFKETVRKLSPSTVVFSDVGPDIRWVGNEKGIAGITNWNTLNIDGFTPGLGAPSTDTLTVGNKHGTHWIPAECDVSIRPGWFYHAEEDGKVKSPETLFQLYLKSIGRGATLLLNVPPDRRGLFHASDSAAMVDFKQLREVNFRNNLARNSTGYFVPHNGTRPAPALHDSNGFTSETITLMHLQSMGLEFKRPEKINCVVLNEDLSNGQSCAQFSVFLMDKEHKLLKEIKGTTIGRKRIISFPAIENVSYIGLGITEQKRPTVISEIGAYYIQESLIEQ
jgi:alpha-L-fucosidase